MLKERFIQYIESQNLVHSNDTILLAVSGGIDSIVMMQLFLEIRAAYQLTLAVAHMNHSLRGSFADRDEYFVREICRKYKLRCFALKRRAARYSRDNNMSIEAGARKIRFDFLAHTLKRLQFEKCALAHHADDQAETILLHLFRGLGLRGLGGIRSCRNEYIHPLLFARKYELEQYAKQKHLDWVTDETNTDKHFLRNKIRIDIIQDWAKKANMDIVPTICRSGLIIQEADHYIKYQVKRAIKEVLSVDSDGEIILDIYKFLQYFKAIQKELLIQIFETHCHPGEPVQLFEIERMIDLIENGRNGGRLELSGNTWIMKHRGKVIICVKRDPLPSRTVQLNTIIELKEIDRIFQSKIISDRSKIRYTNKKTIEFIDFDKIKYPLSIRSFHPGDRFVPLGMKVEKKIKDYFIDQHIPVYKKDQIPLLVSGNRIVWIMGHRMDDRFKVTGHTKNVLKVQLDKYYKKGTL